jgi:hypothetical protein
MRLGKPVIEGYLDNGKLPNADDGSLLQTKLLIHADGTDGAVSFTDATGKAITNTAAYDSYTKLLCHFDTAKASSVLAETGQTITYAADADCTNAQSKFGGKALALDGTGDYISLPNEAGWDFGTGNFTIDGWIKYDSLPVVTGGIISSETGATAAYTLDFLASGALRWRNADTVEITSAAITTAWTHFAIVRNSNTCTMYIDGVSAGSYDCTGDSFNSAGGVLAMGRLRVDVDAYYLDGWLDEVRISKGIARWTSAFTKPAYPYGQVVISTTQKEFGTASAYFDGSGSNLTLADSDDWNFGSGDVTVDCWIRFSSLAKSQTIFFQKSATYNDYMFFMWKTSNVLQWDVIVGGVDKILFTKAFTPVIETWYHIALVRTGNDWKIFVNGTQVGTTVTNSYVVPDFTGLLQIGGYDSSETFNGYIDELRISKGVARWTANFPVPAVAYADSDTGAWDRLKTKLDFSVNAGGLFSSQIVSTYSLVYTGSTAYLGGVLAVNGDIHFVPRAAPVGQKVNLFGTVSTYSLVYTQSDAYFGGALSPNGDVHFAPRSAIVGQKISASGTVSTYSLIYTTTTAYVGGVVAPNGDLHFIPFGAAVGQKVSLAGVVSTYSLIHTISNGAYNGGVLAINGDIHFVPLKANVGQKISAAGVVSTYSLAYTTNNAYWGGVLSVNGDIYFIPQVAPVGQKVSSSGVVSTYALAFTQDYGYSGGIIAPNGDIHLSAFDANAIGQKISSTGVVSTYSLIYSVANGYLGAVINHNGDIYQIPYTAAVGQKISTMPARPWSKAMCCSPFFNNL